jgi:hypothetical protein
MTTRVKRGFRLLANRLTLSITSTSTLSPMTSSVRAALIDLNWCRITNNTWDLVPHPVGSNVITEKWIFKYKFNSDGSLEWYKAHWVLCGFIQ